MAGLVVPVFLLAAVPGGAALADTDWTGAGGDNNWNNPANWSNGVPAGGSTSDIDNGLGSTVTVDGVDAPLNEWTNIGQYANSGNVAVINGGSLTGGCCLAIGVNPGRTGILTVSGPGSTVSNWHSTYVGWSSTGEILVENGGSVFGGLYTVLGAYAGSSGTVTVTGANSLFESGNGYDLLLGGSSSGSINSAQGTLNLLDGGTARANGGSRPLVIANSHGSTGTVNIGNGGAPGIVDASSVRFGNGTGTLNFNHNDAGYNFATPITGNGTVNILAGTTIFGGANSHSGETRIEGGELKAGGAGAFSSNSTFVVNSGTLNLDNIDQTTGGLSGTGGTVSLGTAALTVNQAGDTSYAGVIGGTGSLTKTGAGALELTGANTYSGGTTISGGTLQGNTTSLQGDIANNAALVFDQGTDGTYSGALSGTGSFTKQGVGVLTLAGTNTNSGGVVIEGGELKAGGAGAFSSNSTFVVNSGTLNLDNIDQTMGGLSGTGGTVSLGTAALTVNQAGDTSYAGVIGGTGSVTKSGAGMLEFTGNNTFSGGITVAGGTLRLGSDTAAGTGAITTTGSVVSYANGVNSEAPIVINSDTTQLEVNGTDEAEQSGVISEIGGARPLEKIGSGTLTLSGANTYSGGTTISAGTLVQGAAGAFSANTAYTINGGILDLNDFDLTASSLSGSGGTLSLGEAAFTLNQAGDTIFAGNLASGGNSSIDSFTKTGSGKLTLTGTGGLAGNVLVEGGTLEVNGAMAFSGYRNVGQGVGSDGTLIVSGAGAALSAQSNDTIGFQGTGRMTVSDGAQVNAWNTAVGDWASGNGTLTVDGAGSVYSYGNRVVVGNQGQGQLTVSGGATVQGLDSVNYGWNKIGYDQGASGQVLITGTDSKWIGSNRFYLGDYGQGTLTIADGGLLQTNQLLIAQESWLGVDSVGVLNIGAAAGDGAAAPGSVQASSVSFGDGDGTINFNHNGTGYVFSAPISGDGAIDHLSGETRLTGDSSGFSGTTSLTGGHLRVDGSLGGALTVGAGATLSGTGTLGGSAEVSGTLSAGNSPGTLTIGGDLTLTSSSVSIFEFGAPGVVGGAQNDLVDVGGNLTLDGTLQASVAAAGYYRLFNYGGAALAGSFDSETVISSDVGFTLASHMLLTDMPGEVNLLALGTGQHMQFWDGGDEAGNGAVDGGSGTWDNNANWTGAPGAAEINDIWRASVGVFAGAAGGTVTIGNPGSFDTLQFATDGYTLTGGNLNMGPVGAASTLNVDGGVTATVDSAIVDGGSGYTLVKAGTGKLILTGANSYSGGTTVSAGTLQGNTASLQGDILNNAALVFDQVTDGTYGDIVSGTGSLTKSGAGRLNLTGAHTHTGGTNVLAGILAVNGSTGFVTVDGGRLGGTGTIGGAAVNAGGIFAPGNSIGTTNISGDVTFNAGSLYEVEVDDGGNVAGVNNDLISATGTATIDNGASVNVLAENGTDDGTTYADNTSYTILTAAGGVNGTFGSVSDNFAFLDATLSYDATNVFLKLTRNDLGFASVGESGNQQAAAAAIDTLGNGAALYDAIVPLSAPQAKAAFDALSGEAHATAKTAMIDASGQVRGVAMGRVRAATGGVSAPAMPVLGYAPVPAYADGAPKFTAPAVEGLAGWGQIFGSLGRRKGDANAAGSDISNGGFLLGFDAPFSVAQRFGLLAGYSRSNVDTDDRASSGAADNFHFGAYGAARAGRFDLRFGGIYTSHRIETDRTVAFPGFIDTLAADYRAGTAQVFGEAGVEVKQGATRLEPFAGIAYVNQSTDGFTESGTAAALTVASSEQETVFTTLGMRAERPVAVGGAAAQISGTIGWRHGFGDIVPTSLHTLAGGGSFSVAGAAIDRDVALVEAGLAFTLGGAKTAISYEGEFGSRLQNHALKGTLRSDF